MLKRTMRLIILVAIALVTTVKCIIIDCHFEDDIFHNWSKRYTCKTRKFNIKDDTKVIKSVLGEHSKNRSNDDVTQYLAKGLKIDQANMNGLK
jgi:hypothetical protein